MTRFLLLCCLCALLTAGLGVAQPAATPTATLEAQDQPTTAVLAELSKQLGRQVGVVGSGAPQQVSLSLKDAKPDEAVGALAEKLGASWVRVYVLESQPPAVPYTADQLFAGMQNQRDVWFESLPELQRQAIMAGAMLSAQSKTPPVLVGAGIVKPREDAAPNPGAPQATVRGNFDAVRQLILPRRSETVTVNLERQPLPQALHQLITASGFLIAAGADLTGEVTLQADKQPLEQVIAQVATQVQAQWRPIYLLSVPRPLSEGEMNEMVDGMLQTRMNRYWSRPAEERAQEVQKWVDRLNQWGNMARQTGPDGQPNMMGRILKEVGPRVSSWMMQYMAGITPDQRNEIKPLFKALQGAIPQ